MSQPIFPSVDPTTGRVRPSHLPEEAVTSDLGVNLGFTTDPHASPGEGELLFILATPQSQYFTDFTDTPVGQSPSGWTHLWSSTPDTLSVVSAAESAGGVALLMSGGSGTRAMAWDMIPTVADAEIVFKWSAANNIVAPQALLNGSDDQITGYQGGYIRSIDLGDAVGITLRDNRNGVTVAEFGLEARALAANTWHISRMRHVGNQVAFKTWPAGQQEPTEWDFGATTTDPLGPGVVGIRTGTGSIGRTIDWVGVGLYGDTAPMVPVSP